MKNFAILLLIILPFSILIHELGHAFFAKVFGAEITKICIGTGRKLLGFKKFEIRIGFCFGGECIFTYIKKNNIFSRILVHLGGVLFNAISAALLYFILILHLLPSTFITNIFILTQVYMLILNLLPFTIKGLDTDGKLVLQLFKKEKFSKLLKDEKNYEEILNEIDTEINRLKKVSKKTTYEFMKSKYIREMFYKSNIQRQMGMEIESIITLGEVYPHISILPESSQIRYYNNLLYYTLIAGLEDNLDDIYNKLINLLSKDENRIHESDAIKDTIEKYKLFRNIL